jgi:hypothetical protein
MTLAACSYDGAPADGDVEAPPASAVPGAEDAQAPHDAREAAPQDHGVDYHLDPGRPDVAALHSTPEPAPQTIFLALDGEHIVSGYGWDEAAQSNTSFIPPSDVDMPPFDAAPWGGRAPVIAQLLDETRALFQPWDVTVTDTRPASGDYTMVVVSGWPADVGEASSVLGVAPFDPGNANPNDLAFVFSERAAARGVDVAGLATIVAHEVAHTLGLEHITREGDIMGARYCSCDATWGAGPIYGYPDEWQDDVAMLNAVLLPAPGGALPPEGSEAICFIAELDITTGCAPDAFCPHDPVTRGQMAAFLDRFYTAWTGAPAPAAETPFVDVPEEHFAYDAVRRIYGLGITTGTGPTTYDLDGVVTREQMAAFLDRLHHAIEGQWAPRVATPFIDIEDSFAKADIERIYGLGVTYGVDATHYGPHDDVIRAHMALFLRRLWEALGG